MTKNTLLLAASLLLTSSIFAQPLDRTFKLPEGKWSGTYEFHTSINGKPVDPTDDFEPGRLSFEIHNNVLSFGTVKLQWVFLDNGNFLIKDLNYKSLSPKLLCRNQIDGYKNESSVFSVGKCAQHPGSKLICSASYVHVNCIPRHEELVFDGDKLTITALEVYELPQTPNGTRETLIVQKLTREVK